MPYRNVPFMLANRHISQFAFGTVRLWFGLLHLLLLLRRYWPTARLSHLIAQFGDRTEVELQEFAAAYEVVDRQCQSCLGRQRTDEFNGQRLRRHKQSISIFGGKPTRCDLLAIVDRIGHGQRLSRSNICLKRHIGICAALLATEHQRPFTAQRLQCRYQLRGLITRRFAQGDDPTALCEMRSVYRRCRTRSIGWSFIQCAIVAAQSLSLIPDQLAIDDPAEIGNFVGVTRPIPKEQDGHTRDTSPSWEHQPSSALAVNALHIMLLSLGWENTIPLDIGPMGSLRGETFDVPLLTALACGAVVTLGGVASRPRQSPRV